jgi:alpha-glucosidase
MTSFGKRVMWNWKWNSELYPQLDERIASGKRKACSSSPISTRTSPAIKISAKRRRNAAI